jgi:hypothetical protein
MTWPPTDVEITAMAARLGESEGRIREQAARPGGWAILHKLMTSDEIAVLLGASQRAVRCRAARERWKYEERTGAGSPTRLYLYAALPVEIRMAYAVASEEERNGVPPASAARARQRHLDAIQTLKKVRGLRR